MNFRVERGVGLGGAGGADSDKPVNKLGFQAKVKKKLGRAEDNALLIMGMIAHPVQKKYEELKGKMRTNWGPEITGTAGYVKDRVKKAMKESGSALSRVVAEAQERIPSPFDIKSKKTSKVEKSETPAASEKVTQAREYLSKINAINLKLAGFKGEKKTFEELNAECRTAMGEFNHLKLTDDEMKELGMSVNLSVAQRDVAEKIYVDSVRQEVKMRLQMYKKNPSKENAVALYDLMKRISESKMEGVREPCRKILGNKKFMEQFIVALKGYGGPSTLKTWMDQSPPA